jgi:hypothetical protein
MIIRRGAVTDFDLITAFADGDYAFLTDLVRNDAELDPRVRDHLADLLLNLLTGKWKRPAKRPKSYASFVKFNTVALAVQKMEAEGWKRTAAIAKAAELYDCSPRWVAKVVKEYSELGGEAGAFIAKVIHPLPDFDGVW